MIKVLIVEDSRLFREYLTHIIESAGGFSIVGIAENGEEAVALARKRNPDVILMDVHMPRMDGFEATRRIMESRPKPIVVISASWNPDDVEKTFMALQAGALAVLEKPRGPGMPGTDLMIRELVDTTRLMSEVPVVRRFTRPSRTRAISEARPPTEVREVSEPIGVVAIGASTGGPPAVQQILSELPQDFQAPIMIVQHICEGFLPGLAEWLRKSTSLPVELGKHEELLRPGSVYVAPDRLQMGVTDRGRIALCDTAPENGVIPSASYLFRSAAGVFGKRAVGVLLTGMGKDGAEELKLIKDNGGVTIAQDKETSVVFGMPGEAVRLAATTHVLPVGEIAKKLVRLTRREPTTVRP